MDTYNYAYNGLGDRVQQTVNGVTTTYVLDLNTGLTQVLSDGTDTYLYGLSRIGEEDTAWDYYLGDALGSVRQLADGSSDVSLAQTFEPYGKVWTSVGTGSSSYAFTGEVQDQSGLNFLRARYVDPYLNQFIQPDSIVPNFENPQSINKYSYGFNNPIRYTDPSGFCGADRGFGSKQKTEKCEQMVSWIESAYNITIYWPGRNNLPVDIPDNISCFCMPGICEDKDYMNVIYKEWKYGEVTALGAALVMYQSHLGHGAFSWIFSDLVILRAKGDFNPSGRNVAGYHTSYDPNFNYRSSITLTDARVKRFGDPVWTFTHEIAHNLVMDRASAVNYSIQENYQDLIWRGELNPETGPTYVSILYTPSEDLAESITTYLWDHYSADWISQLPTYQQNIHGNSIYSKYVFQPLDTDRINWIEDFFDVIMGAYQE